MRELDSKILKNTEKRLPPNAGKGRVKGVPNKNTAALREMIRQALDAKGGVEYLVTQAEEHPVAFLALLAKLIPTEIQGAMDKRVVIKVVTGV
jgi:hypothetical protein